MIRERVCRDARWLGVELDVAANSAGGDPHQHQVKPGFGMDDPDK